MGIMKMMRHYPSRIVSVCLASAAALTFSASAAETGLYFNAEGGFSFAQDVEVTRAGTERTEDMDVGFRAGVGVGYNFTRNLGIEFDTGWIWNQFNGSDSSLTHHPFIVNAVFRFDTHSKFVPYIGAGLGGTYSVLDVDAGSVEDSDGDIVFAWQAMAGVRYMFQDNMSLGVGYKYHNANEGSYEIEGVDYKIGSIHNHSFSVVFNMTF